MNSSTPFRYYHHNFNTFVSLRSVRMSNSKHLNMCSTQTHRVVDWSENGGENTNGFYVKKFIWSGISFHLWNWSGLFRQYFYDELFAAMDWICPATIEIKSTWKINTFVFSPFFPIFRVDERFLSFRSLFISFSKFSQ